MNPEFQRNLWLEASPRRIAWAGVSLALVYGIALLAAPDYPGGRAVALGWTGGAVFVLCAWIWAARAAGTSVLGEIADRTWDFQRLSALDPWAMTWGKLLGASSLAWMCGLTGLALATIAGAGRDPHMAFWGVLSMLAAALLLQAVSMGAALIGVRKARAEGRAARPGGVIGGLVIGGFLLVSAAGSAGFQRGVGIAGLSTLLHTGGEVEWWGAVAPGQPFRALALTAFAGWALAGAWRLMRLELQMRNAPLTWPAFLVFLALFIGGFAYPAGGMMAALLAGALAVALCAYAAGFAEPADRVRLRQFAGAALARDFSRAAALAPSALAPVALAAVLVVAALVSPRQAGAEISLQDVWQALALIAFVVRDLGVIALFRFGPRPQRGDFGAVVALALLYAAGAILGHSIGGDTGGAVFAPLPGAPLVSLVSGAVQAAIAWWLAAKRIRAPEVSAAA
ncbi:MAG: hypothetical protein Q8M88_03410 [Phenylobacterium sp.]|uniref:hypothetical protein n=1 Tax=Phenylobacterium sp. TaxID=1871053 RepID=UPI0027367DC5|nr:hypothetical protein [Phenylobacterium sp.]MDP3173464.1 hypothetical protein [Phenylobacterium sp.]